MATKKALVVSDQARTIDDADTLLVGVGVDRSASGTFAIGSTNATSVVITPDAQVNGLLVGRGGGSINTNAVLGVEAFSANVSGSLNTAVGYRALRLNTIGAGNVAVGYQALQNTLSDNFSTAVGAGALGQSTGSNNTAVGYTAGFSATSGSNLVLIGYNAQPSSAIVSNQITLGDNSPGKVLRCVATTITAISDIRDKTEVEDLSLGLDFLTTVRPVQFKWDRRDWYDGGVPDGSKKLDKFEPGFIAQELDVAQNAANAEWMTLTLKDNPDRWEATPMRLFPVVVKACQELAAKAAAAEARADAAEARLAALEAAVAALQAR